MIRPAILALLLSVAPALAQAPNPGNPSYPKLTITGPGSTGDVSGMSVTPFAGGLQRALGTRGSDVVHLEDFCSTATLTASAGDITTCLQSAVSAAQATGRALSMPPTPASAGYWSISSTINLGDGSTSAASTKGNFGIEGAGSGGLYGTRGTYLAWTGAPGGTMIQVNGPVENIRIRGLNLNGLNVAARLIKASAIRFSEFSDIYGNGFTGVGFGLYGIQSPQSLAITHSNNLMLALSKLYFTTNQSSAIALDVDGVMFDSNGNSQSNDTWLSEVRNSRFESLGANGTAIRLGFSDNMLWSQIHAHVDKTNGGVGVKFDASTSGTGGNSFPTGHLFVKSALDNTGAVEDATHTIGVNNFVDFGTTDNEVVPTHPKLRGITDQGYSFGGWGGPTFTAYTPTLTAGTPGATPPTFSNVSFRYAISGRQITINGTYTVATKGTASGGILIPLPNGVTSTGLQAVSAQNASTSAAWYGVTNGATLKIAIPSADGQIFLISATVDF